MQKDREDVAAGQADETDKAVEKQRDERRCQHARHHQALEALEWPSEDELQAEEKP